MNSVTLAVYKAAVFRRLRRLLGRPDDPYAPLPAGTTLSPSAGVQAFYNKIPRALGFDQDGERDPSDWQMEARTKLAELTGYDVAREEPAVTAERPEEPVGRGVMKRSFYLRVRPETDLPVHLVYKPGFQDPAPVFLHLAGSTSGVHLAWGGVRVPIDHQRVAIGADMARQAAGRGYLAVAIEQTGYGERAERLLRQRSSNRTIDAANHLLLTGRTLMGAGASDVSAAIDWLLGGTCPMKVRADRLFLFGHSAGGTLAQYAAALDTRIAGVLASGSVGPVRETIGMRGSGGGDGIVPGLLNWFDSEDIIALVAPRTFIGLSGDRDHIYPASGVEKVVAAAQPFFENMGAGSAVQAVSVAGPHQYHAKASWQAWEAHFQT